MKLRLKNIVLIGFAFLSVMILWQGYNWCVPLLLDDKLTEFFEQMLGHSDFTTFIIGSVMGLDNFLALFMIPFISKLSDRTHTVIGKRVPFIIVGLPVALLAFAAIPLFENGSLLTIAILLLLIIVAMNVYRSPAVALMPDITPKPLRGRGNAVINIMGGIGTGLGYIICYIASDNLLNAPRIVPFLSIFVIMFICLVIVVFFVREDRFRKEMLEDVRSYAKKTGAKASVYIGEDDDSEQAPDIDEKSSRKFRGSLLFLLASILFYYMSTNAVESFMSLYSRDILGSESHGIEMMAVLAVCNFAFMLPSAFFAEKIGRNKVMRIGCILMAAGSLTLCFITEFSYWMMVPFGIFGIGMSLMITNMYPAIVSYCGRKDYAKFTGYYYTATMLAQAITPMLVGLVTSKLINSDMRMLMPYACFFMILCAVMQFFVKETNNTENKKIITEENTGE